MGLVHTKEIDQQVRQQSKIIEANNKIATKLQCRSTSPFQNKSKVKRPKKSQTNRKLSEKNSKDTELDRKLPAKKPFKN